MHVFLPFCVDDIVGDEAELHHNLSVFHSGSPANPAIQTDLKNETSLADMVYFLY